MNDMAGIALTYLFLIIIWCNQERVNFSSVVLACVFVVHAATELPFVIVFLQVSCMSASKIRHFDWCVVSIAQFSNIHLCLVICFLYFSSNVFGWQYFGNTHSPPTIWRQNVCCFIQPMYTWLERHVHLTVHLYQRTRIHTQVLNAFPPKMAYNVSISWQA